MALQDHSTPAPYVYSKKNGWLLTFVFLFLNLLTLKFTRKSGNGEKTGPGRGRRSTLDYGSEYFKGYGPKYRGARGQPRTRGPEDDETKTMTVALPHRV